MDQKGKIWDVVAQIGVCEEFWWVSVGFLNFKACCSTQTTEMC